MKKLIDRHGIGTCRCALLLFAVGCGAGSTQSGGAEGGRFSDSGGRTTNAGGSSGGTTSSGGTSVTSGRGGTNSAGGNGGTNSSAGGSGGANLVTGGSGATTSGGGASPGSGGGASPGTGGSAGANPGAGGNAGANAGSGGSGGVASSSGGSAGTNAGSGGGGGVASSAGGSGGTTTGGVPRTVELIGPGAATCGATNATHGDGFVCVLNYPSAGPNIVGYWFDYAFSAGTCNLKFTKPSGNNAANPQICFSGSACPSTSGGGLGAALCDVHGIDVSTWPQLMMLESASKLSTTVKSPFSGCNPGATMTSVSWTLGSGSLPAGTSVLFDDASDVNVARVDAPVGATSVEVPASVDTSQVASIKFSVSGASSASWNFCLTSLKVSMR